MSTVDRHRSEYAASAATATAAPVAVPDAPPVKSGFRISTFDALRYRDYRLLWVGILFTSAGMWMEQVALNWIVYSMTGSAVDLGILNGMRALPSLITGPFGGVAADRMDRKQLMLWTGWALVALYVMLAALIFSGGLELWHLMAFSLATGVAWTFNQPVRQALIPSLVPKEAMMNAVALQSAAFNMTRIIGPALGGLLMGTLGAGGTFVAVTLSFLGVQVATWMMQAPAHEPRGGSSKDVWRDLMEGFRYIGRTPDVRGLIIMALVPFVLVMPFMTLLTIFAKDIFMLDATGFGFLMSVSGIGALSATLGVASLGNFRGKGGILTWSSVAMGVSLIAFAFSPFMSLSYAMLIVVSGASMAYLALTNTMLNMIVPNEFRGRVMSVYMLDRGLMPLGSMLAGGMAGMWGAPVALGVMGAGALIFAAFAYVSFPNVRNLE